LALRFHLPSSVRDGLRRRVAALAFGGLLAIAWLLPAGAARADGTGTLAGTIYTSAGATIMNSGWSMVSFGQNPGFTWGGTGSTTATTDYNLGTNWANPPVGAPPVSAGQAAVFGAAGSSTVVVTAGPVTPDSWTFNANARSFAISGAAVNFNLAGAGGGIIDNANFGQTISISNNIGETVAGVQVQQLGNSTLILSGTNTYTGGTTINAGTLQLGTLATTGSIVGTVINAGAFSIVNH